MAPTRYLAGAFAGFLVTGLTALLTYSTAERHHGLSTVLLAFALAAGILAAVGTSAVLSRVIIPSSSPRVAPSRRRYAAASLAFIIVLGNVLPLFPTNNHGRIFGLFALAVALGAAAAAFYAVTSLGPALRVWFRRKRPPR